MTQMKEALRGRIQDYCDNRSLFDKFASSSTANSSPPDAQKSPPSLTRKGFTSLLEVLGLHPILTSKQVSLFRMCVCVCARAC